MNKEILNSYAFHLVKQTAEENEIETKLLNGKTSEEAAALSKVAFFLAIKVIESEHKRAEEMEEHGKQIAMITAEKNRLVAECTRGRPDWPADVIEQYPWVKHKGAEKIPALVKRFCIADNGKHRKGSDCPLSKNNGEMTSEEYERYQSIVRKLVDVIQEYKIRD